MSAMSLVNIIRKARGDDIKGAVDDLKRIAGFPEEVAERIATGELPMDEASRVARRDAQTMPETYYHGTNKGDIKEINMSPGWRTNDQSRGFWASDNPGTANTYADDFRKGTLYPVRVKRGETESYNYGGNSWGNPPDGVISAGANTNDIARKAFDRGVETVEFRDIVDVATSVDGDYDLSRKYLKDILKDEHGPDYQFNPNDATSADYGKAFTMARRELLGESNNVVVGNDSLIRSPNAAYDPQYKGSNIMGGAAGTAGLTGLLAAGQSDDSEASVASLAARGLKLVGNDYDGGTVWNILDKNDTKLGGADMGFMDDGNYSAYAMQLNPEHRGTGLMSEAYDAIEEVSGMTVVPSDTLTEDGLKFWMRRDPQQIRDMADDGLLFPWEGNVLESIFAEALKAKR